VIVENKRPVTNGYFLRFSSRSQVTRNEYVLTDNGEILEMTPKATADFVLEREEISEVYCKGCETKSVKEKPL
jgi:hypothetical protein